METEPSPTRGFRTFVLIWVGQVISLVGTGLTGFALGVHVYQGTGSVTKFSLIWLFTAVPGILFSPVAGVLVDRWNRRTAMIVSDAGAGLCTLTMVLLSFSGRLQVWEIYIAIGLSSTLNAFQFPAYSAATTLLVPKDKLSRASGMVQIGDAAALLVTPVLGGILMSAVGVQGVMLVDVATMLFAITTLLAVRIPQPPASAVGAASKGSLWRETAFGWRYIRARHGLLSLLLFFTVVNGAVGFAQVLFTPLVLSFTTEAVLGALLTFAGLGFLGGSVTMSLWGGPKRRVWGILGAALIMAASMLIVGFPPSAWHLGLAAFLVFFATPISTACSQAIWQVKTEPDVQGRVFATRRMIQWATLPVIYLATGTLADHVFEPLMAEDGALAGSVGRLIGVGPGRGIALIYALLGLVILAAIGAGYAYPPLRRVELELPDAKPL